ncbi:MAG: TIGR03905 family TSCPD domain-containing protein [Elusimicrobiota bacterium]|jgi:uncharacterized protein (TIGR03905 family)|nr:TIGR03905 family TSCPD domain-containing protein [Elusimicrobiota bacterium]
MEKNNNKIEKFEYKPSGVCSTLIEFQIEDGLIKNVVFTKGCNGNGKGIAALVEGMAAQDVMEKLSGIKCKYKSTSCPDQLAKAVDNALNKNSSRAGG